MGNITKGGFDQPFVVAYNEAVQRSDMSMEATGLLVYLLSLPDDWKIHKRELHKHFTNGRDACGNALEELIQHEFVIKREIRDRGKFKGVNYEVFPVPYQRAIELGLIDPEATPKPQEPKPSKESTPKEEAPTDDEAESIPFEEIITYLNDIAGKSFKHQTKATRKAISGRWNDGFKLDDFKHVIRVKTAEWKGTSMDQYLAPSTLFRPSNFEKYLNQKDQWKPKQPSIESMNLSKKKETIVEVDGVQYDMNNDEDRQAYIQAIGVPQ